MTNTKTTGPEEAKEALVNASIFNEITEELSYQEKRWGTKADDTINRPNDWVAYISHYATKWFTGGFAPYSDMGVNGFRKSMIKVAALAVAAVKSLDRQRENKGSAFYEISKEDLDL